MKYLFAIFIPFIFIFWLIYFQRIPIDIYLIPLILCGIISLYNIITYYYKINSFRNLYFYVWLTLFVSTYIAPLIHFSRNSWMPIYVKDVPSNWNLYSFYVSSIYFFGTIILIAMKKKSSHIIKLNFVHRTFKSNALIIIAIIMLISFLMQTYYYLNAGGFINVIIAFLEGSKISSKIMSRMGIFFLLSEIFPYMLLLWYFITHRGRKTSGKNVILFLIVLFISSLYFGGTRGSRSNTIYIIVQAVILIHYTIYKFSWKHTVMFMLSFIAFMFVGRLYKDKNVDFFKNKSLYQTQISSISVIEKILTGDICRYNIMCYEIYKLRKLNNNYSYKNGGTYVSAIIIFFPYGRDIITYFNLPTKDSAGAEMQ